MKKVFVVLLAALLVSVFISPTFADQAVDAAKATFKQATSAYVDAKEKLSDAQIKSIMTVGKSEKQEAVTAIKDAKKEVIDTKKAYKAALHELKKAEIARDANIDRSPWN